ncbi:FMN adenylyltransferase /riboflavin kinase [Geothermobacter ehrlichii]|uniref:Riboflavin biosynthesis protein n=1 Tax=Geothermobacter ehrlichii TaxID=213224 RepID=A0A5D3WLC1_9BACT|nr:bifunctional riboflavin kinase/FAD synthetase [Geothermobacter ehrlichii]TYO99935.1 FMN adenylyltransferase /riboflavin kinase [Geothermobacter ehrlichii]
MRVVRSIDDCRMMDERTVVTIGNFDGVHLGHREIFRRVIREAKRLRALSTVVTFDPHPLKVLAPEQAPRLLNTREEKERLIRASCIDLLAILPFDRHLAAMEPEDFVRDVLVERLRVAKLIVGHDYAFGRGRKGDVNFLLQAGGRHGFEVEQMEPIMYEGQVFSSTLIRRCLGAGDVRGVVALLGRHFNLEGRVIRGANRGRKLGFPTANLLTEKEILPRPGVYAVKVKLDDTCYDGVMNIGFNPTFGLERISLEVHLLDFEGDLYGRLLRVYFVDRLRDELVFSSAEELAARIRRDISEARRILGSSRIVEYREYLDCGAAVAAGQGGGND